jgi:hypothetical protein
MKNKFSALMSEANIKAKTDSTLRKVLEETDWSLLADNYDHRLNHFLAIKKYLSSEKKND